MKDNHFEELKSAEIISNRMQLLRDIDEYTGNYYSKKWIQKNILQMSEDVIEDMKQEIADEQAENPDDENENEFD